MGPLDRPLRESVRAPAMARGMWRARGQEGPTPLRRGRATARLRRRARRPSWYKLTRCGPRSSSRPRSDCPRLHGPSSRPDDDRPGSRQTARPGKAAGRTRPLDRRAQRHPVADARAEAALRLRRVRFAPAPAHVPHRHRPDSAPAASAASSGRFTSRARCRGRATRSRRPSSRFIRCRTCCGAIPTSSSRANRSRRRADRQGRPRRLDDGHGGRALGRRVTRRAASVLADGRRLHDARRTTSRCHGPTPPTTSAKSGVGELAGELRGERLVVRDDERRPAGLLDHTGHRVRLPRPRDTEQGLGLQAFIQA